MMNEERSLICFSTLFRNIFETKHTDEANEKILAIDDVCFEDTIDDVDPADE